MATTAELIQQVAAGDTEAWGRLAERHLELVRGVTSAICGDTDLAEDALQDTFLRLRAGAGSFRPRTQDGEDDGRRWIRRLAANCSIDRLRQRRRDRARMLGDIAGPSPPEPADEAQHAALGRAMSRLSAAAQTALTLRYRDGLEGSALATALGVGRVAARVRLHRAITALRRHLASEGVVVAPALLLILLANRSDGSEVAEAVPDAVFAAAGPPLLPIAAIGGTVLVAGSLAVAAVALQPAAGAPAAASPAAAAAAAAGWAPLFPDLAGWRLDHGTWSLRDGAVLGVATADDYARVQSVADFGDIDLRCRVRVSGPRPYAELQIDGYNRFYALPAGAGGRADGWAEVVFERRGDRCTCTVDGNPVPAQNGRGEPLGRGPLAFYVAHEARMEIAAGQVRVPAAASGGAGF